MISKGQIVQCMSRTDLGIVMIGKAPLVLTSRSCSCCAEGMNCESQGMYCCDQGNMEDEMCETDGSLEG